MNPKIEKLTKEIEKTRDKIAELQAKQRDLEKQRTELENTDIVALVRSLNLSPEGLAEFIKSQQAGPAARGGGSPQGLEDGTHEE